MNDPVYSETIHSPDPFGKRAEQTIGSSSIYRICEEIIALREVNNRQHKMFEQTLTKARDALQASFNTFAGDTQRAYQQLRQEMNGDKRFSLAMLNELVDLGFDMEQLVKARPATADAESLGRWADSVEVQGRKVQSLLQQLGVHPYDAVIGSAYNPALHERVGSRPLEGMGAFHVVEQREHGYASQQPEFVLRRAKVVISE